jgi:hypothetical protein
LARVHAGGEATPRTADEGIELLTGIGAGQRESEGQYPEGSLHAPVDERLEQWARLAEEQSSDGG